LCADWMAFRCFYPPPPPHSPKLPITQRVALSVYIPEFGGKGVLNGKCYARGPRKMS
jgi:hypothetical protein